MPDINIVNINKSPLDGVACGVACVSVSASAHGGAGQDERPSVPFPRTTEVFERGGLGGRLLLETREEDPARCEHTTFRCRQR